MKRNENSVLALMFMVLVWLCFILFVGHNLYKAALGFEQQMLHFKNINEILNGNP